MHMMRILLRGALLAGLLTVLIAAGSPVRAQLTVGFAAGPTITTLRGETEGQDFRPTLGYYAGLQAALAKGPLAPRAGATFIDAGTLFAGEAGAEADEETVGFLTVPIDLRVQLPLSKAVQPFAFAGPEFRYVLTADEDGTWFEDDLRQTSAAAGLGAGVALVVPGLGLSLSPEVRYAFDVQGLTDARAALGDLKADMFRFGITIGY